MLTNYFKEKDAMELITQFFAGFQFKSALGVLFILLSFGFDELHIKAMTALLILLWGDCISAMFVAYKKNVVITSAKFFRTPIKIAIYFGLIYFAHITEYGFPEPVRYLDDMMIAFALATEMLSILENVEKLGYPVPNRLIRAIINLRDGTNKE